VALAGRIAGRTRLTNSASEFRIPEFRITGVGSFHGPNPLLDFAPLISELSDHEETTSLDVIEVSSTCELQERGENSTTTSPRWAPNTYVPDVVPDVVPEVG
jgi:hypothetical protein